jgi:uncharacterized protein YqjF (DUF2071 family)
MMLDRSSIRLRPEGLPIMRQHWGKLLFMHWPIDAKLLRPLIPKQLSIDTFEGSAWIGVIPFTMWGIRASFLPPIPGTSAFHELNVRTYVTLNGMPGVWFLSLDAANRLAVWGARKFYYLPYFNAQISLEQTDNTVHYSSTRQDTRGAAAQLKSTWIIGEHLPQSSPGSIEYFLTERYCLYSAHNGKVYRSQIHHSPWPLQEAKLTALSSSMIESHGLPAPKGDPLLHYAEELSVDIWWLKKVEGLV